MTSRSLFAVASALGFFYSPPALALGHQTGHRSAGPRVVFSEIPSTSATSPWRVGPSPKLSIGGSEREPDLFTKVVGVVRQSSGNIVVADGGAGVIKMFDSTGRFLRTVGRPGSGPGEFRQLLALFVGPADSIIGYDVVQGWAVFDAQGRYARTITYGRNTTAPFQAWAYGWFSNGSQLAAKLVPGTDVNAARRIDSLAFYLVGSSGRVVRELFHFPAFEVANVGTPFRSPVVFGPTIAVAVWPDRYCVGYGRRYEIQCARLSADDHWLIRTNLTGAPVPAQAKERFRSEILAQQPLGGGLPDPRLRRQREEGLRHTVFAVTQPVFAQFVAATSGELWVRRYDINWDLPFAARTLVAAPQGSQWDVFDLRGTWIAAVLVPGRFRVHQVGHDYVLGVGLNRDDEEVVFLYPLHRP